MIYTESIKRRGYGGMQKESLIIFVFSLLLAIGIVGGIHFWFVYQTNNQPTFVPNPQVPQFAPAKRKPATHSSNNPIECFLADGSTFWTNANRCEDADLNNQISHADQWQPSKPIRPVTNPVHKAKPVKNKRKVAKKPNLRGPAVSPPRDTPRECRFSIGKALDTERKLSTKDDPRDSIWFENYCEWLAEARSRKCKISTELFYYSRLC